MAQEMLSITERMTFFSSESRRVTASNSCSDGMPAVNYQYDAEGAGYSWGLPDRSVEREFGDAIHVDLNRAQRPTNGLCASIDPLGRVTASNQQTAGEWYGFTYYYDLTGALTYETYPSGRGITTGHDAFGRGKRGGGKL
jgi:hypothetical protein